MGERGVAAIGMIIFICLTLLMASVVFNFSKSLTDESVVLQGKNIVLTCSDILFESE